MFALRQAVNSLLRIGLCEPNIDQIILGFNSMIQRCQTQIESAFWRGVIALLVIPLRFSFGCINALLWLTFPSKAGSTCSSDSLNDSPLGNSAFSPWRRSSQFQKHSNTNSLAWANLSPNCFGMIANKTCQEDSQDNFNLWRFASRRRWSGTTKFLIRLLPATSRRSSVQASGELFSPKLRFGQFSTNPDASVCHRDHELNHTVQRSAEAQLRAVRPPESSVSANESGAETTGPSSCQERIHNNEENNVSQCIANRGMSDCDHRRRAA